MNLDRKLMAYAAGALAAGVVGSDSADAAVIADSTARPFNVGGTVDLDLNNDATIDFNVGHERQTAGNDQTDRVILKSPGNGANSQAYVIGENGHPAAVPAGTLIGPDSTYDAQFNNNVTNHLVDEDLDNDNIRDAEVFGNFTEAGGTQYVGVQFAFEPGGSIHYGWIGVDITNAADLTGVVTGYAYESVAETPIEAGAVPEPSAGLALLAVGAAGLLRRKRS